MASQVSPQEVIHTGLWRDYASGSGGVLTLTISTRTGGYLIAFLAIFVRLAAGHFWDICTWIWFHLLATDQPKDGLFHQHQVLLRNNLSDSRALWQFTSTAWAWRKKANFSFLRSLPIISAALIHFVAFTAAGIFSSRVTSVHSNVLISGPVCGEPYVLDTTTQAGLIGTAQVQSYLINNFRSAITQTTSCHSFNGTTQQALLDCKPWGSKFIPYTITENIPCPFGNDMCVGGLAVELATGLVDTAGHLGINARDHVQFRNRRQCAPIKLGDFKQHLSSPGMTGLPVTGGYQDPHWYNKTDWIAYNYGPSTAIGVNSTYLYANTTFGYDWENISGIQYRVDVRVKTIGDSDLTDWAPISSVNRTDADTSIFFIVQNQLVFTQRSDDPVFGATEQTQILSSSDGSDLLKVTIWTPREEVTVMACTEQWTWCQPENNTCSDWDALLGGPPFGPGPLDKPAPIFGWSDGQQSILNRLNNAVVKPNTPLMTSSLSDQILLSSSNYGSGLPDNQWIRELDHWYSIYWNTVQLNTAQWAIGNGVQSQDKWREKPEPIDQWMCNSQVVQRSDYASFNMEGVLIILCFGVSFLIISFLLDPMYRLINQRRAKNTGVPWISLWRRHYVLQLLTVAFEAAGLGHWDHDERVPTTTTPEKFRFPLGRSVKYAKVSDMDHGSENNFTYQSKIPHDEEHSVSSAGDGSRLDSQQTPPTGHGDRQNTNHLVR